ncbi:thioesterase family protein [Phaeobacter gallaeciensis]|uniref:Thioesterase family protein n=2 Tax=Roseobacteraceae TaxID=2854170 RepID=A0A366XCQ8_9RHOB|nr:MULTISPECIES: thioesterase family protein [Roseobacteraceae]MBT3142653.1 thioesterase family protein [Falsiruegeria litorea]MBT8168177.1 thioesterase family protein [Falsiruegeria litorea]RBW61588.1 thioesterase family protein [Phaeobacter gallaeciensis]
MKDTLFGGATYFTQTPEGVFLGNDPARGPWSPDHCHAGPVTGLVARAAETAVGPDKMLTRLTLDVLRPLPVAGLVIETELTRNTRTLATTRVEVHGLDGTLCMTATSMHLTRKTMADVPTAQVQPLNFEDAIPADPLLVGALHEKPSFGQYTETAFPPGVTREPGPKTVWMRTPALLEGEDPSPIQSMCALADCGNGISWNAPPVKLGFMNTDLTLQIHREPVSNWLASEAISHWHDNGLGMSHSILHDTEGPVGVALQTLVLHPIKA